MKSKIKVLGRKKGRTSIEWTSYSSRGSAFRRIRGRFIKEWVSQDALFLSDKVFPLARKNAFLHAMFCLYY